MSDKKSSLQELLDRFVDKSDVEHGSSLKQIYDAAGGHKTPYYGGPGNARQALSEEGVFVQKPPSELRALAPIVSKFFGALALKEALDPEADPYDRVQAATNFVESTVSGYATSLRIRPAVSARPVRRLVRPRPSPDTCPWPVWYCSSSE